MPTLVQRPPAGSATTAAAAKRRPARRLKYLLAALAALLLHAVLIVLLAWALPHWPRTPLKKGATPITLTIQPPEPSETPNGLHKTEVVPPQPEYMRTNDAQKAETPPPDSSFSSDKDTNAAAEKPADDPFKPLPTQDGKEIAAFDFATNPYLPGKEAHDNSSTVAPDAAEPAPTPPPATPKPDAKESPTPRPANAKPTPTPGEFLTLKPEAAPSDTPPEPSPSPTPESASTPPPPTRRQTDPAQRNPSVASTGPQQPRGYQPQTTQTKLAGSIDNRGKSSVSARGTPLGKYQKAVEDAIGARWYFNVEQNMSNLIRTGEVKVHFVITRNGKIINTRLSGPNQNTTLADISLEAVVNAEVPPIPSEVAALLPGGQLEGDLSFIMY